MAELPDAHEVPHGLPLSRCEDVPWHEFLCTGACHLDRYAASQGRSVMQDVPIYVSWLLLLLRTNTTALPECGADGLFSLSGGKEVSGQVVGVGGGPHPIYYYVVRVV